MLKENILRWKGRFLQKVPIPSRAYLNDARGLEECFQEEGRDEIPVSGKETRAQIWEFPKVNTGLICLNILLFDFRSPCHSDDGKEEESVGINVCVYGPFTRFGMTRGRWLYFNKSGLKRWVRSKDCCNSHSLIFASWPESRMSGTFHPLYSAGRV